MRPQQGLLLPCRLVWSPNVGEGQAAFELGGCLQAGASDAFWLLRNESFADPMAALTRELLRLPGQGLCEAWLGAPPSAAQPSPASPKPAGTSALRHFEMNGEAGEQGAASHGV